MFLALTIAGVLVFALLASSSSEKSQVTSFNADEWQKQMNAGVVQQPQASSSTAPNASDDAIVTFYKSHGLPPPPEYPAKVGDLGEAGDLDSMDQDDAVTAAKVLYEEEDVAKLMAFASLLEESGFEVAANRFRQKALRIVDSSNQTLHVSDESEIVS